jgi:hypothetical protein
MTEAAESVSPPHYLGHRERLPDGDETEPGDEAPGRYDHTFFLGLAAKGKDAWNAWRRDPANKDVRVTFAAVDFRQPPWDKINFEGFEFGEDTDFSHCKWRGAKATGHEAFSPGCAHFTGAEIGSGSTFTRVAFGSLVSFQRAKCGHLAISPAQPSALPTVDEKGTLD